jgi:hypothetical protein
MGYNPLLALVMPLLPSRADRTPNLLIRSYLQDLELMRFSSNVRYRCVYCQPSNSEVVYSIKILRTRRLELG